MNQKLTHVQVLERRLARLRVLYETAKREHDATWLELTKAKIEEKTASTS